jgi:pilus assembly protein Flp/PilA
VNHPDDTGASAVEYGMLLAAVAVVIMLAVFGFGGMVAETFRCTTSCITSESHARC